MTQNQNDKPASITWHAICANEALDALTSSHHGLSSDETRLRQMRYGPNRIKPPQKRSPFIRFMSQFNNVLIYVLLVAAAVTALLSHWVDTTVIVGVVILNAIVGFVQEGKAEHALDAIKKLLSHEALVRRDGGVVSLSAEDLVPGDIVLVQPGDKIPADLRWLHARDLEIDEAILTGESLPVAKQIDALAPETVIADRSNMGFSGTLVTAGQGEGLVVETGDNTEIGRISSLLKGITMLTTPLLRQMDHFGRWLTGIIIGVAALTCLFGVLVRDYSFSDMFLAAVGLAVAAIPEGLPAIMTITLAIGVQRMAHRRAIIRRLPAVETLGSITVICSDKTGTLTCNEMTVTTLITADKVINISGSGYDPHGGFFCQGEDLNPEEDSIAQEALKAALLCNDAQLRHVEDQWTIQGDPTEAALLTLAVKAGLVIDFEHEALPRTDVIPFDSKHRFMATLHHDHQGHGYIFFKGAPEKLLEMCASQQGTNSTEPIRPAYWEERMHEMAGQGQRLLAIARRKTSNQQLTLTFDDIGDDLTLLAIVGIMDPPRAEAIEAVRRCHAAGIKVKMITGDHAITARAIGKTIGLHATGHLITGSELDEMDDAALEQIVNDTEVFARASPEHKLRIITALQANEHVVAMTGDGVNDAPALKRADVGVAMGKKGTEVAKEAAEMVLTDDSFASISHAIEEGRTVYDNLKKAILFILPTNGGEALIIIAAVMLGRSMPITPVQILWINMVTAVTLALSLAFEPAENSVMQRPPRSPAEPLLSRFIVWRIVFVSLILVSGTFGLFVWERSNGASLELARTVAVNTLVMFEIFYLFNCRFLNAPVLNWSGLTGNRTVWWAVIVLLALQMAITYLGPMQTLFKTVALDWNAWLRILLVACSVLFLVEMEKAAFSRKTRAASS